MLDSVSSEGDVRVDEFSIQSPWIALAGGSLLGRSGASRWRGWIAKAHKSPGRLATLCLLIAAMSLAGCSSSPTIEQIREMQALGRFEETLQPLRRMVGADPSQAELRYLLGRALLHTGDTAAAVGQLRKAARSPIFEVKASILLTRALMRNRSLSRALKVTNRVLELEPENIEALSLRMSAHVGMGKSEAALADIDRVLSLTPDNAKVLVLRMRTLIALSRIDEATEALKVANERLADVSKGAPNETRAMLCVLSGLFAYERGEKEEADEQYEKCLWAYPNFPVVVEEAVSYYDRVGERERATQILKQAHEETGSATFRDSLARRTQAREGLEGTERLIR
jgi:tetratricopeptide (TPR) repeat protein